MVFSSLIFLYAFLPLSLLCYALCPTLRAKNLSLLVFSLIFYAWGEPKYVLLLMLMAAVDWFCALRIEASSGRTGRKIWLSLATVVDLGLIAVFKYAGMIWSLFGPLPPFVERIVLPIGISFYTFQLLTYVVDVYRGDAEAERAYWHVLLYASLFHQCIAGPIVRYNSIADELFTARSGAEELTDGIRRFTTGLAKKALLANPCGALADALLLTDSAAADPGLFAANLTQLRQLSVLGAWVGVAAFMLQIYLDFSAYSDMAIGMGKMLGLHYPENFNYPYTARSVTDFWHRWHMSLSGFFRDYVYIPLGGSRCSAWRAVFNTFLVWALTGLWHGASWNFVLWGLYYFVFLMLERGFTGKLKRRAGRVPRDEEAAAAHHVRPRRSGAHTARHGGHAAQNAEYAPPEGEEESLEEEPPPQRSDKAPRRLRVLPHLYLLLVVLCGWILFRFRDIRLGLTVLGGLAGLNGNSVSDFVSLTMLGNNAFLLLVSAVGCTPLVRKLSDWLARFPVWQGCRKTLIPVLLLLLSTCALVGESYNPFLYFQF